MGEACILNRTVGNDSGSVDKNVDASEVVKGTPGKGGGFLFIGQIHCVSSNVLTLNLRQYLFLSSNRRDTRALLGKTKNGGHSNSAGGTCNDCHFPIELHLNSRSEEHTSELQSLTNL